MHRFTTISFLALALGLLAACGTARAVAPTALATLGAASTSSTTVSATSVRPASGSSAAAPPSFVTGTIQSIVADRVVLNDGESFPLTPRTSYVRQVPITPSDLMTGMYVGIVAKRQGDTSLLATIIDVFSQQGAGNQFPIAGGALMTNATIDQIAGDRLTVSFTGGGATVQLAPDAQLYRDDPGTAADVKPGSPTTLVIANGAAVAIRVR
jgi:hypothetical protein